MKYGHKMSEKLSELIDKAGKGSPSFTAEFHSWIDADRYGNALEMMKYILELEMEVDEVKL